MRFFYFLSLALSVTAFAKDVRVKPGAHGGDGKEIAAAVKEVAKEGGGTVTVAPGEYLVSERILFSGAKNVTLRGEAGTVLKLAPLAYGKVPAETPAGAGSLKLQDARGFKPGMQLKLMAPGAINSFTNKPVPSFNAKVTAVDGDTVTLAKPTEYPAPAGTEVLWDDEPNLIDIRDGAENITIEQLTLDGMATADQPQVATHNTRCAVWVTGNYSYEKGPIGPKPRGIVIRDCVIRRFHGRGVALYSVEQALVERCRIEQTQEEAIDFDHFTERAIARENDLRDCRLGVEINDANDCTVERNRMIGGTAGVRIWRWCKMPELNVRNQIVENEFRVGKHYAIEMLEGTAKNSASGNEIFVPQGKRLQDAIRDRGEDNQFANNVARD